MNEVPDLFSESAKPAPENVVSDDTGPVYLGERVARIERSALWAAYGDALGWISELTDAAGLMRRTGGDPLKEPMAWERRIGGRWGVMASLPRGCYSDDSQLRLATSRAIRSDGFDVEAFAKVELPVWLSYGLGGGRSTSAAAVHLSKRNSAWWSNKFKGWSVSGGNGAAMRVQPHVWAARSPQDPDSYLPDVVRNAVCTHSHPTGLMGAVLHALCVAHAMNTGRLPMSDDLLKAIRVAERLPGMIEDGKELGYWRTAFDQEVGNFDRAWADAIDEVRDAVSLMSFWKSGASGGKRYRSMIDVLKLRDPSRRGSGILTALAAAGLTWCEARPANAMRIAANAIGTDTDTIATMAGAILGATADVDPPTEVLDISVFRAEAHRLAKIADGGAPPNHVYPDLLHWSAPKTRADALLRTKDGELAVSGLGRVAKTLDKPVLRRGSNFNWQWVELDFGQTLFIKGRNEVPDAAHEQTPVSMSAVGEGNGSAVPQLSSRQVQSRNADHRDKARTMTPRDQDGARRRSGVDSVQKVVSFAEQHIHDDATIGRTLRRVASKGTTGEIAAFTAALIDLLRSHPKPNNRR